MWISNKIYINVLFFFKREQLPSDEAIEDIQGISNGSARMINKVCKSALISGFQNGKRNIDVHMVKLAISGELS